MTRGNPKNIKGEAESAGAPAVSERARKGRVPATAGAWLAPRPAAVWSRRGGRWRLTLEVLGLQKLRTTKLNTKGERRRASERRAARRQPPALPAPCRGAGVAASPGAGPGGRSALPCMAACPGCSSHLVVNVGWALRGHLLDDVDGVPVVPAHLLVVRAVVVLCSP